MNKHRHLVTGTSLLAMLVFPLAINAQATRPAKVLSAGKSAEIGIVTGDKVNVRSGSDQNYYAVTRVSRGDELKVLGEQFGWLEIVPPAGTYSIVDKTFVDVEEGAKSGVVNGSAWVTAGSDMSERHYAKQVRLNKGAKVSILGESVDGDFYKIAPPAGATLWIAGDFVRLTGTKSAAGSAEASGPSPKADTSALETVRPGDLHNAIGESPSTTTASSERSIKDVTVKSTTVKSTTPEKATNSSPNVYTFSEQDQIEVKALEAEITAESAKPLSGQNYDPILVRLDKLAMSEESEITQRYATARAQQVRDHADLIRTLKSVEYLTGDAIAEADKRRRERDHIKVEEAINIDDIIVKGEIEVSTVYQGSASRPKRWRVTEAHMNTDPDALRGAPRIPPKTIAYIEIPEGSSINPNAYHNKYVGIRASKRRLIRDAIPPIPIYTVAEIVLLERGAISVEKSSTQPAGADAPKSSAQPNRGVVASPASKNVAPPASQPAGAMKPVSTDQ